jgi:hypothetical protein
VIRNVVRYQPPDVWGVLCIDIWQDARTDEFYQTFLQRLSKYPVGAVVNCTLDLVIDYADVSVYNTLDRYHWRPTDTQEQIRNMMLLDLVKASGQNRTSRLIHDALFDQNTVHISQKQTFNYHVDRFFPDIKDWIVLGSAWGKCLHYGPLGIDKLVDLPNWRFHIFPQWSIQTETQQAPDLQQIHDDYFVWAPIEDDGYRLITRAQNHKWIETT